jgi:hypothetical protein
MQFLESKLVGRTVQYFFRSCFLILSFENNDTIRAFYKYYKLLLRSISISV